MFCSQCGKKVPYNSKFCIFCGSPIPTSSEEEQDVIEIQEQVPIDPVEDLKKKIKAIDKRKKPPKKQESLSSVLTKLAKKEASISDYLFDSIESEKEEDKRSLIKDYPIPTDPKKLANLAKYVNSQIPLKKDDQDSLTELWIEKQKQIYEYAKSEFKGTDEFWDIGQYYKGYKRRNRHEEAQPFVVLLALLALCLCILAISYKIPWLIYLSFVALGWIIALILVAFNLLEKFIMDIKKRNRKRKSRVPKFIRVLAWHLLVPIAAILPVVLVFQWGTIAMGIVGIVLGFEVMFLCIVSE